MIAGRAFLEVIPWTRDDRLAEGTLTVALAYLSFIAAQRLFDVSGVVAVLAASLTVSAFGRTRIAPYNWSFLKDLWEQIAFWAHSLVFLLASILVPRLLFDMHWRDLALVAVLIVAAFAARLAVLFLLLPMLSLLRLTHPISTAYKLAIAWGGLRGALTLVLALGVTENPAAAARGSPLCCGARDRARHVHAHRQRHDAPRRHPAARPRSSVADRPAVARPGAGAQPCGDQRHDRQDRSGA